jgi:DNA-directed RNA polymerase subunit RPC12/RpoP
MPALYRPDAKTTLVDIRNDPFLTAVCRHCGHRRTIFLANYRGMQAGTNIRFVEKRLRCESCGKRQGMLLAQEIKRPVRDFRLPI